MRIGIVSTNWNIHRCGVAEYTRMLIENMAVVAQDIEMTPIFGPYDFQSLYPRVMQGNFDVISLVSLPVIKHVMMVAEVFRVVWIETSFDRAESSFWNFSWMTKERRVPMFLPALIVHFTESFSKMLSLAAVYWARFPSWIMQFGVLRLGHHFKVLRTVIRCVFILVMHVFISPKFPAKNFLHYGAVFKYLMSVLRDYFIATSGKETLSVWRALRDAVVSIFSFPLRVHRAEASSIVRSFASCNRAYSFRFHGRLILP